MVLLLPVHWVIALVKGRPNASLHEVYAMYLRYALHVYAYATLAAEPFPGFLGTTRYPVDVIIPPPGRAEPLVDRSSAASSRCRRSCSPARWAAAWRPASARRFVSSGLAFLAGFLAWFAILARGRIPAGLRDVMVYALGYGVQTAAYLFLVTGAYPDSDPRAVQLARRPRHPVRIHDTDEPRRSRMTVGFRYVLATPHFFWSTLWVPLVLLLALPAWISALVLGRLPRPLHRFFSAFTRYTAHFNAFFYLAAGPFPGFVGKPGSYPVDLEIDEPERQSRWSIAFRWLLAIPAIFLQAGADERDDHRRDRRVVLRVSTGRMPRGIQRLNSYGVRYIGQMTAYALLLTPRLPAQRPERGGAPARRPVPPRARAPPLSGGRMTARRTLAVLAAIASSPPARRRRGAVGHDRPREPRDPDGRRGRLRRRGPSTAPRSTRPSPAGWRSARSSRC